MEPPAPVRLHEIDWSKARPAIQKDAVDRPFVYYVPVAASGAGANNSLWRTAIHGRNTAAEQADIVLRLTPRGRPMQEDDPITDPQYVEGGHAIRWDDPLATFFGASGSGWLLVASTHELAFSTSYTFNQAADGTEQGQGIPVFAARTIMEHLANAGDVISFELYGTPWGEEPTKRENLLSWVPPESGGVRLHYTVIGEDGGEQASGDFSCEPGTYEQVNDLDQSLGLEVRPGSRLRLQVHSVDGSAVAIYAAVSKVDNLNPEKQDPQTDEGAIDRLIESSLLHVNGGEVNDPAAYTISLTLTEEATVEHVSVDWLGQGTGGTTYDGGNSTLTVSVLGQHSVTTGTFTPRATATITRPGFGQITRTLTGKPYTIIEEQSYTPENSYETTEANIDFLAGLFGNNVNVVYLEQLLHYGEEDMETFLTAYTNGLTGQNDPELETLELDDRVNRVYFRLSTGTTAAWGGFTELQMNQLRTLYGTD